MEPEDGQAPPITPAPLGPLQAKVAPVSPKKKRTAVRLLPRGADKDPRDVARRYVYGKMEDREWVEGKGAIYQYIRLAHAGEKAAGPAKAALDELWKIAKMDREDKGEQVHRIEVLPICRPNDDGKIYTIESA